MMVARVVPFVEAAYGLERESIRQQTDCVQRAFKAQRDFLGWVPPTPGPQPAPSLPSSPPHAPPPPPPFP